MNAENKTVLLPSSSAQNKLTDFVPEQQYDALGAIKNAAPADYAKSGATSAFYDKNLIVSLSYPLFKLIYTIINLREADDIVKIREELIEKMDCFAKEAAERNLDNAQILIARYLLCAYIDEMIGTTFWGKEHNWAKESLLSFYYHEAYGGEKFFRLLSKLLTFPANHINLLELMYICLSMGFEGKYRLMEKGRIEIEAIRDNLYKQIRNVRGRRSESFYAKKEQAGKKSGMFYKANNALILIIVAAVLVAINLILSLWLSEGQDEIIQAVNGEIAKIEKMGRLEGGRLD
ncbi:MAG: type IVB secretion system protein IcmH/DotU [Helicobacteraceae bacterium]|jgi:type VI secretion system protein ImpK|nr:type IVB secretion system protein IcmH/DotU [Helicobacteraceae bacterium]